MNINMTGTLKLVGLVLAITGYNVQAEQPDNLQPVPEPPPAPNQIQDGEAIPLGEPQITIIQRGENLVREYRINGHLFAIKIIPKGGRPYFLIDVDGDGDMETQFLDNNDARIIVPQWVIARW